MTTKPDTASTERQCALLSYCPDPATVAIHRPGDQVVAWACPAHADQYMRTAATVAAEPWRLEMAKAIIADPSLAKPPGETH